MKKILLFFLFWAHCLNAIACDCGRQRASVIAFNSYEWIFTGSLIAEVRPDHQSHRICVYKVISGFRGVAAGDTVRIYDAEDSGACGLGDLTVGVVYLMYATGTTQKWTSRCLGNSREPVYMLPRDTAIVRHLKTRKYYGGLDDTSYSIFHEDTAFLKRQAGLARKGGPQKFYDRAGKLASEGRYKNGIPEGFWRYYKQGKLNEYGNYRAGKKDSIWVSQYDQTRYLERYRDGEYTYEQTYYYNGKISSKKGPVGDGKKWTCIDYHDNGKPRYIAYAHPPQRDNKGRLKDPVWNGSCKTFNKAGILLEDGVLQDGFYYGHWQYYYETGQLRMEGDYTEGKKSGVWKIYYPDKRVKATGTYENNEKLGNWQYFDKNGKAIRPDPGFIKEDEDSFTYSGVKK